MAALVTPIALSSSVIRRQAPLSIAAVFIFALTVADGELTRLDGVTLLILLLIAMLILIKTPAEAEQPNSVADQSLLVA